MQVKGGMQKSECVLHLTLIIRICMPARRAGTTSIRQAIHIECRQYIQNTCQQKCSACSREDALDRGLGGKKCNMRLNRHMYSDLPICLIHCNENPIYVFLFWEFPHSCVCERFIYIPRIGPHIFLQQLILEIYKSLKDI